MVDTMLLLLGTARFRHVFDRVFLGTHLVAGMAAVSLSGPAVGGAAVQTRKVLINDSQDAELERSSKHQRYQLKGIAHLAFCTKVVTGLWWWAAADKLKGYTGVLACSLSATSWVHALATPYTTPTAPHRMLVVLQGCSTACANLSPASQD